MKGISVRQPWAWLLANGYKPVENRTWITNYRGPILIHASQKIDREGLQWVLDNGLIERDKLPQDLGCGGFVGVANLSGCVDQFNSPWFFGPYGFVMDDAKPITFIPYKGKLGIFNDPEIDMRDLMYE